MRAIFSRIGSAIWCDANRFSVVLVCAALIGRRVFLFCAAVVGAVYVLRAKQPDPAVAEEGAFAEVALARAPVPDFAFEPPRGTAFPPLPDLSRLTAALRGAVIGRGEIIEALSVALLANGHALLEGAPGLAKTTACRTFAAACGGSFGRIQCHADLSPAEVTGSEIYDPRDGSFRVRFGPVCANLVLADEINRAPARTQAAFFEAMEERQITIASTTRRLPRPFMLLATMNEAESEGIFPLPRAQLDRFLLKVAVDFPEPDDEFAILESFDLAATCIEPVTSCAEIEKWQDAVRNVYCAPRLKRHIVELVAETRAACTSGEVEYGAGPRASIALLQTSRGRAAFEGRAYVLPADIRCMAAAVLRHRVAFSHEYLLNRAERSQRLTSLIERARIA